MIVKTGRLGAAKRGDLDDLAVPRHPYYPCAMMFISTVFPLI
jgi:hypothetical protein